MLGWECRAEFATLLRVGNGTARNYDLEPSRRGWTTVLLGPAYALTVGTRRRPPCRIDV